MTKKFLILGLIMVSALTFSACTSNAETEEANNASADGNIEIEGEMNEAQGPKIETVDAFGIVTAEKTASISVDFNAKVEKIYVQTGEKIKKGDPLVAFDISDLTDSIKVKEREHAQLVSRLNTKNYEIEKLELQLESDKKSLNILKNDYSGKLELNKNGSLSDDELRRAKLELENKELLIKNTEISILSARANIRNERENLNNQITSLTEDINRAKDKLVKSNFVNGNQVVSSFDNAVVTEVASNEGDFVNREIKVITLTDLDSRIVNADIAEEFISNIKVGQSVIITSSALQGKEYEGKITRIWGSSIKKGGETIVPIEISIDNLDDDLLLNFNVDVKINL